MIKNLFDIAKAQIGMSKLCNDIRNRINPFSSFFYKELASLAKNNVKEPVTKLRVDFHDYIEVSQSIRIINLQLAEIDLRNQERYQRLRENKLIDDRLDSDDKILKKDLNQAKMFLLIINKQVIDYQIELKEGEHFLTEKITIHDLPF